MSEQPREGMRAHSYPLTPIKGRRGWYRCERCGEEYSEAWPTVMGCAPPCEPAQPQPRGEEARDDDPRALLRQFLSQWGLWDSDRDNYDRPKLYRAMQLLREDAADPAPPRGEGDDLAARTVQIIRNRAKIAREQGTTEAQIIRARALDEAANEFADILPALRASTHPEQSARVECRTCFDHGWVPRQLGGGPDPEPMPCPDCGVLEPAPEGEGEACPVCGSTTGHRRIVSTPEGATSCPHRFHDPAPEGEGEAS